MNLKPVQQHTVKPALHAKERSRMSNLNKERALKEVEKKEKKNQEKSWSVAKWN